MTVDPLILYIPGLKPKPQPDLHRRQLQRCLLAGVRGVNHRVADAIAGASQAFDIASWTFDFYGEHRDLALDMPGIEALLKKAQADAADIADARSWQRRLLRAVYRVGDRVPFLIPRLANENMELQLRDLRRYVYNVNGAADAARRHLTLPLRAAHAAGRPVLLLAHSMGSVIAWDALWCLSRDADYGGTIGLLMTLGSPLGQRYIQRRLLGANESDVDRYPHILRRWINIAAVGELTALDPTLANDFSEMQRIGLVQSIEDVEVYNWFRYDGVLNVHAEYGYLANRETASRIIDWWQEQAAAQEPVRPDPGSA